MSLLLLKHSQPAAAECVMEAALLGLQSSQGSSDSLLSQASCPEGTGTGL